MKARFHFILLSLLVMLVFALGVKTAHGYTKVRGYVRRNGKVVRPHIRTSPNHTKSDNWSTKGNVNPFTGKKGYKKPR